MSEKEQNPGQTLTDAAVLRWRGAREFMGLIVSKGVHYAFDLRYGVDTRQGVSRAKLSDLVGDRVHAEPYEATRILDLRRLFRILGLAQGRVFVDLGSGKGRVLMVAEGFGFRALRGVEFSGDLCAVARANLESYRRRARPKAEFEIIHADAAAYPVRDEDDVFYLFNPFDDEILRRVMANITRSFEAVPRHIMVIYSNPRRAACITENTPFVHTATHLIWRNVFAIFEAKP